MVAETHNEFAGLSRGDIIHFIVHHLSRCDEANLETITVGGCGFEGLLDIEELAELVGEEFGERTLTGPAFDDVDNTWTVAEFVAALYPAVAE
jgi:hypothetical protein